MKFNLTYQELKHSENDIYTQGGQDGVIYTIFRQIGYGGKFFVEFGARDGVDISNTANLRINFGWDGLLMDISPKAPIVKQEKITATNINQLLEKYNVINIDFLSIDIDGNDMWVWKSIKQKPRVVLIEYNSKFKNTESFAIEYNEDHSWEGDDYYGASLLAMKKIGEEKGYKLVHVIKQLDAVFVRNDLIDNDYIPPTLDELLPEPIIAFNKISNKKWGIV